ncbi:UMP-CMP kinase 2, mitochondrial, partial [Myotis brandtii]
CTPFMPEARAVLELVDQCPRQVQRGTFPVIVMEGLDATGKTTVTQAVAGVAAGGPFPGAAGRSGDGELTTPWPPRYWHSTAAYAIATEVSGAVQHLPPAHHPIYQWPKDLLRPNLVVLLTVSPEERLRRIRGRGPERTSEEEELEANSVFRQKVEVSYERMESPGCHAVDASPSRERVLQAVLSLIRDHCPQRP